MQLKYCYSYCINNAATNENQMAYSLPTTSVELFLSELNEIRRGIHSAFRGDGIYNSEAVLSTFCRNNPVDAIDMAIELDSYDKPNNFHPIRIKGFAKKIRKNLFIQNIYN